MTMASWFGLDTPPSGTPADAAQKIADSLSASAKGTPLSPFVDPVAKAAADAAKQVEDASKKSYVESVLASPAAKVAAGALGLGAVWYLFGRKG